MPTSSRPRPRVGLLLDALYNEYASMVVAAFDGACAERDYDLLCFAGGSLHSLAGYELQRNRCFELASAQSLDAMVVLSLSSSATVMKDFLDSFHQLGYAMMELGPRRRVVYELLRELISAALRGAELVRRVAEEAAQREKAEKDGDVLLLYTDGVVEAANAAGEHYGTDRLCAELEAARHDSVTAIRDRLLSSVRTFLSVQDDDIALLVARHPRPAA